MFWVGFFFRQSPGLSYVRRGSNNDGMPPPWRARHGATPRITRHSYWGIFNRAFSLPPAAGALSARDRLPAFLPALRVRLRYRPFVFTYLATPRFITSSRLLKFTHPQRRRVTAATPYGGFDPPYQLPLRFLWRGAVRRYA